MGKVSRETLTKPRVTPVPGNRKATERFCQKCKRWHRTYRHLDGKEVCPDDMSGIAEKI